MVPQQGAEILHLGFETGTKDQPKGSQLAKVQGHGSWGPRGTQ